MDYKRCLISKDMPILKAMGLLDELGVRVLFITENEKLIGSLADSDIRRWLLSNGSINVSAYEAANKSPKYLVEEQAANAKYLLKHLRIDAIPIINKSGKIINIEFVFDSFYEKNNSDIDIPVVIMAGGKGTRLYPYTKILPKPLIPVEDIPISERIIKKFYVMGCRYFLMILNYKKNMIKAYFSDTETDYNVKFIDEQEYLGTAGGLKLLKSQVNKTFILTNCDVLIDYNFKKIYEKHIECKNAVTMICSLMNYTIPYGVVEFGKEGYITNIKEKPSFSFFTNSGVYIIEPEVLDIIKDGEKIDFPDLIDRCREHNMKVGVFPIGANSWTDMGQFDTMEDMEKKLRGNL